MKILFRTALSVITAALISACYGDAAPETPIDPSAPDNIEILSEQTYTPSEFCSYLGECSDDYLEVIGAVKANVAFKAFIANTFEDNRSAVDRVVAQECDCKYLAARSKWAIKIINFSYYTESYTGEPIKLSAALCVPYITSGNTAHTLDAISLCPPHMPQEKENCPTLIGTFLMSRVCFNHAVVVPDYQGRGLTAPTPYSSLHTHAHAVQAIDAALAADTILNIYGYKRTDDYELYNVGVSEGGEVSYEVQKIIENDIPESQRNKLNLKLTFSANGIAQHSLYVTNQMSVKYNDEAFLKEMLDFYKDAFDCLSEEEKQGHSGEEFYSKDILDETGNLIPNPPIFEVLKEAVAKNDITCNWDPKHPITIAGCYEDNDVFFEPNAQYMYDLIHLHPDGTVNTNVSLLAFSLPLTKIISDILGDEMMLTHIMADVVCFMHAMQYEDPTGEELQFFFL